MAATLYGKLESETTAQDLQRAREIVREINNFGVSERQRWAIMYFLALELENVDDMKAMTSFIKERKGESVFLVGKEDGDGTIDV